MSNTRTLILVAAVLLLGLAGFGLYLSRQKPEETPLEPPPSGPVEIVDDDTKVY